MASAAKRIDELALEVRELAKLLGELGDCL